MPLTRARTRARYATRFCRGAKSGAKSLRFAWPSVATRVTATNPWRAMDGPCTPGRHRAAMATSAKARRVKPTTPSVSAFGFRLPVFRLPVRDPCSIDPYSHSRHKESHEKGVHHRTGGQDL